MHSLRSPVTHVANVRNVIPGEVNVILSEVEESTSAWQ